MADPTEEPQCRIFGPPEKKKGKSGYIWELCHHHYLLLVHSTDRNEQLCHCHFRQCQFSEISLMKWQFVAVTNTVPPAEIPPLLDSWITNTPAVKMLCPQHKLLVLTFS